MYMVKFIRKDTKPDEDYFYSNQTDAGAHIELFLNDDSNLYKAIVLSNESENCVQQILLFDENGHATSFKERDIVRLRTSFCGSDAERRHLYTIENINDRTMRCSISCLNCNTPIPVSEVVGLNMLSPVGMTLDKIIEEHTQTTETS